MHIFELPLQLFIQLFEARYESLEILAQLEIKKMLLDRLVNLLSRGYVIPVVKYIRYLLYSFFNFWFDLRPFIQDLRIL